MEALFLMLIGTIFAGLASRYAHRQCVREVERRIAEERRSESERESQRIRAQILGANGA